VAVEVDTAELVPDQSEYDRVLNLRLLKSIPVSPTELEAAYRQGKNDTCEITEEGEPLVITQFLGRLTSRDKFRETVVRPGTRRHVASIGLSLLPSDARLLPTLSRSTILRYIDSHFISLQARIEKDPVTAKWQLQYRPIAVIGSYSRAGTTQSFVDAIVTTIRDIRGLGIYRDPKSESESQTAILLFRSEWLDEAGLKPKARIEYCFMHAVPKTAPFEGDPISLHFFFTSDDRTEWHYFPAKDSRLPQAVSQCSIHAKVRFVEFDSSGLEPKSGLVRQMQSSSRDRFGQKEIEAFLKENNKEGTWDRNLTALLDAVVESKIPRRSGPPAE
jgi:hypothetical protein